MPEQKLLKKISKESVSDIIIQRITDSIISGDLKPGDKIPTEMEFSESMGISRNAVREAIKVLVAFGVVEVRRSEGTFIVQDYTPKLMDPMLYGMILSEHSMEELLEYKIANAYSVTMLAMKNATPEDLKTLRKLGEAFMDTARENPVSKDHMYKAAVEFNKYVASMINNRLVEQTDEMVHKMAAFTRHKAIEVSIEQGRPEALPENYLMEVEVLESGDRNRIIELMDARAKLWNELLL